MAELTHDAEDGFHEIQLSGKQLVFLFMATTVVSVVIFLCGVLVGRGVRARARRETRTVAAAAPVRTAADDQARRQRTLRRRRRKTPLSYHERLQPGAAPAEKLKKATCGSRRAPRQAAGPA